MAIAFDAAVSSQDNTGTGTSTWTHTCSGSNRILLIGFMPSGGSVSGTPTYNGVGMTQIGTFSLAGTVFQNCYLYYLIAPATGANTVSVSYTGASYMYSASASYTGVDQSSPIDVSGNAIATSTSLSKSLTTTVNNDWLVGFFGEGSTGTSLSAGANTTFRVTPTGNSWSNWGDSNGAETPAGSFSLAMNAGVAGHLGMYIAAIKPVASSTTVLPFRSLLGVGI